MQRGHNLTLETGERIRYFRTMKKLSQEELGLMAAINPAYIGQIERGSKSPTVNTLNKICTALNISLSELFNFGSKEKTNGEIIDKISNNIRRLPEEDANKIADIVDEIVKFKY